MIKKSNISKIPSPKVFDVIDRTDSSPKKNSETEFDFFNRSARSEIGKVRDFIEKLVINYPKSEVKELISRLRSGDDVHFKSATFELCLHEALIRLGFSLVSHPQLSNGKDSRPDFLVTTPEGDSFYLEAVLATQNNEVDDGAEKRKGVVLDMLNSHPHDNFLIAIDDVGSPQSPPSAKKLKNSIHAWLDSKDPDELQMQIDNSGVDSLDPLLWSHDGWDLQILPIPLNTEARGKSTELIGIAGISGGWIDNWSPIAKAIKFKGSRYGELDKPLIVAVNHNCFHLGRIDELQALFGQEKFTIDPSSSSKPRLSSAPNGAWIGSNGPQYTRVSAVWLFNDLHATSIANRRNTLYINPWAQQPIPHSLKCFPSLEVIDNKFNRTEGISFREVFELSEHWPED